MSKAVLISIKPQWCELIANGQKTVEVRKNRPNLETPFKCYIYCTKGMDFWISTEKEKSVNICTAIAKDCYRANGKVIGEFICNEIVKIFECYDVHDELPSRPVEWWLEWDSDDDILSKACLSHKKCLGYLSKDGVGYGWRISDLVIYDEPKDLCELKKPFPFSDFCLGCEINNRGKKGFNEEYCDSCDQFKREIIPPQTWRYVEEVQK